ncbi:pilus assembly FimT family protein [Halovulum sp. GXIMD14793]
MSRSDGFTILEAMVSLAILAMIMGISISAYRRGNPGLEYRAAVGEVIAAAHEARRRAIRTGTVVSFRAAAEPCDDPADLIFYPDGSVQQMEFCVLLNNRRSTFRATGLTGAVEFVE